MNTQTQTKSPTIMASLGDLPILKHFDQNQLSKQMNATTFRKGEKGIYSVLRLLILGAIGYGAWVYVLPPVFQALGQLFAVAATGVGIVALIMLAPVIFKGLRRVTRLIHKALIKYDPFAQLEDERAKMIENQRTFRVAKANIAQLKNDMEIESEKAKKEAESGQTRILTLNGKANKIKAQMDEMVKTKGVQARGEDEYVHLTADFQKTLAEAQRVENKYQQSKNFIEKYGTRANIMKKMGQKLTLVETAMDIKISDFDATVEMLKKDYEFGRKANAATTAAKSALGFTKGWELDYALDVVTSTISADIAMTSGNLRDIETLTNNFNLDSDEMFANLNLMADKINLGQDLIPDNKKYSNPEYKLTQSDVNSSGGFGEMF